MNVSSATGGGAAFPYITVLVLFFLAWGFLLGLMRGWKRSLFRFGVVILSVFLAFTFTTTLSNTLMSTPISELSESIEMDFDLPPEVVIEDDDTLADVILISITSSAPEAAEIFEASPTLSHIVLSIPMGLVAIVLFVPLFYLIKTLLAIPGKVVDWIFFRRKGSRLLGGVIGAVQGLFVACVILLPIFGLLPTVETVLPLLPDIESAEPAPVGEPGENLYEGEDDFAISFDAITSDPMMAVLESLGIRAAGTEAFYQLTTVTFPDGSSMSMFRELNVIAEKAGEVLEGADQDDPNAMAFAALEAAIETPLIANTISEIVCYAGDVLSAGGSFMGMSVPTEGEQANIDFMQDVADTLAAAETEDVQADLPHIIELLRVLDEYGVFEIDTESDPTALDALFENEDFVEDLLTAMTDSTVLSPIVVSAVNNLGITTVGAALEMTPEQTDELKSSVAANDLFNQMTPEQRRREVENLALVIILGMQVAEEMDAMPENNDEALMAILPKAGRLLDAVSSTQLLGPAAAKIMSHILTMEEAETALSADAITAILASIEDGTICYENTLSSIVAFFRMSESLNVSDSTLHNPEDLQQAIGDLYGTIDETTATILKEALDESALASMGIPEASLGAATTLLGTFFDEIVAANTEGVDTAKESAAIENSISLIVSAVENPADLTTGTALEDILDAALESEVVTATLVSASDAVDLSSSFTPDQLSSISDILDTYEADNAASDNEGLSACVDALRAMLGIQ